MSKPDKYPDQWKTHDTPERQERERAVIQEYCERTDASGYWQGGIGSRYDAQIYGEKGELREIIEVKQRKLIRQQIDAFNIDMKKVDWLREASLRRFLVPAWLVVQWQDGELSRVNLTVADVRSWSVQEYANKRRREFADLQYLIPVGEFETV